jgi:hypothetical protein
MRQKVEWLRLSLKGEKHGRWFVNIDTKLKTIALHIFVLLAAGGIAFLVLKISNLSNRSVVLLGIIILLINYLFTTYKVDKFHEEIGSLIKKAKSSH